MVYSRRKQKTKQVGSRLFERLEQRALLATFAVGDSPESVAIGDLNGDGITDLVAANQQAHDVSVLMGVGNGAFADHQRFDVGTWPDSVTLGDVNGDGILDIATANNNFPGELSLLLGVGDGTFADQRRIPADEEAFPDSVTLGDVNGDGFLDIVTASAHYSTPHVSVLLGVGDGTFAAERWFSTGTGGPGGSTPNSVALGDVNGDGFLDIVTSNFWADGGSVLLGAGNGTFAAPRRFATGDGPGSVTLGDVNGDSVLDIVTRNEFDRDVSVLLGVGDGTFAAQRRFAAGNHPWSVALGDVNADGALDLVTANGWSDDVSVLLGMGDGTFAVQRRFAVGDDPFSLALGDLNGDGILDLVTANRIPDELTALFGVGDGTFTDTAPVLPTVSLSANQISIAEAGGTATITATLSQLHSQPVTINLETSGTATQNEDYTTSGTRLTIAAGETTGSINIAAIQDSLDEMDETVVVDIVSVVGGIESGVQQQTLTIIDDDEPPVPEVTLSIDSSTVSEAGGVATLTVSLSEPTTVSVAIDLAFSGTAAAGDFDASAAQIVVAPGATSGSVTVTAVDDLEDEDDETVVVDIVSVTAGTESEVQQQTLTIIDNDAPPMLTVEALIATSSGFTVEFATKLEPSGLNLYNTQSLGQGPADVALQGTSTGSVSGSLVVGPGQRQVNFVKTGGPLVPDTYTVTLRSGANGFIDLEDQLLDGNNDGTEGDDYVDTFTIVAAPPNAITLGTPDIVRGPGQPINVPASTATGIPMSISDGTNVRAIDLRVAYDPALLNITGAAIGPDMPAGASVIVNTNTPGLAIVVFFSSTALPAGSSEFLQLQASVPESVGVYGTQQVLDVHAVTISDGNDNEFPAIVDDSVHLVSYLADASGNGRINASDASQVARFAALIDSGFSASLNTDPAIVADVSGNGRVNAADASLVAQFSALIEVPKIPPIPSGTLSAAAASGIPGFSATMTVDDKEKSRANDEFEGGGGPTFRVIESFSPVVDLPDRLNENHVDAALADSETMSSLEDVIRDLTLGWDVES